MAVVVGEAVVRIRGDADASEIRSEVEPEVSSAMESAGESGADAFSAKMALGVAAAGAGIAAGFAASLEQAALGDKLAAQLGLTEERSAEVGGVAGSLYANAYGESLEDVNIAVGAVMSSIGGMRDASSTDLEALTANALDFATAFDQDVTAAAQTAGLMMQNGLAANGEQAFDLLTRAFQQVPAAMREELPAILDEYGTNFSALGFSGEQAMGMLVSASAGGAIALDKTGDALKEFTILGRDLEANGEVYESLGLDAQTMAERVLAGGESAGQALQETARAILEIEDPVERSSAAISLFGGPLEDLGVDKIPQFLEGLAGFGPSMDDAAGAVDQLGETLNSNASTSLTTFWRTAQQAFVEVIGGQVVPIVERIASFLATNLGPVLDTVGAIIGEHVVPPLRDLFSWLGQNETLVRVLAGVVGGVLVAALTVWGTRAVISGAQNIGAWFSTAAASTTSAGRQSASALQVVTGWVLMGARAVAQGIKIAAVWTAQIVASAVRGAAAFAVQVARVVAGWVLMGAQSLIQAARIAAAWLIAMGPIALVIAAVVGLVYLIVSNWETIWNTTTAIFGAIWGFIQGIWDAIVGGITAAVTFIWGLIQSYFQLYWTVITTIFDAIVGVVTAVWNGIVGFISGALSGIASTFTSIWGGIVGGIRGALDGIWNVITSVWGAIAGFLSGAVRGIKDTVLGIWGGLVGGIRSAFDGVAAFLSGIFDGIGDGIKSAINAVIRVINTGIGFINDNLIDTANNIPFVDIPHIPRIPLLHAGGVFDSGTSAGEGLALLRDDELVATPEQRKVADDLLRGLLDGDLLVPRGASAAGGQSVTIVENVYAAPGESAASVAARTTQGVVWNLNAGITRPAPLPAGA